MNRESADSRTDEFMRNISYGSPIEYVRELMQSPVDIFVPNALAENYECQCLIFTTVNELVRLGEYCPTIRIHMPATTISAGLPLISDGNFVEATVSWVRDLPYQPDLVFLDHHAEHPFVQICIRDYLINLACSGWSVHLSLSSEPMWGRTLPVIACIASSWLVAEIIKILLSPIVPGVRVTMDTCFNFWDYTTSASYAELPLSPLKIPDAILVGAGGIGSAVVYALLQQRDILGGLTLVDDDLIDNSNLNRVLYAREENAGDAKADLAHLLLVQYTHLTTVSEKRKWGEYVRSHRNDLCLVLGAVDEDLIRQSIQSDLPKIYVDGGTGINNWRVSRHNMLEDGCIYCLTHSDTTDGMLADLRMAGILESAISYRTDTNSPFSAEDLIYVPDELKTYFKDQRPQDGWRRFKESVHCGEITYLVGQHMSAPHLSSMPGFIMALELIKGSMVNLSANQDWNVVLGNLNGTFNTRSASKMKSSQCPFCGRLDYVDGYRLRWNL